MINTKKAFTLVELIVVITILAILGTIAFISLQGYSADARNSKRTQDLNNIAGSINIKTTEGAQLIGFVTTNANAVTSASIAGITATNSDYKAGEANYTALNIKGVDFKDPQGNNYYPLGVTTFKEGQFEIAASMENGNGAKTAKINGTYKARGTGAIDQGSVVAGSGTTTITINPSDINKFLKGDTIDVGAATGLIVKSVSANGVQLTLSAVGGTGTVQLTVPETAGLTANTLTLSTAIIQDGTAPY